MVFLISFPIYFSCLSFLFAVTPSIIPVKKFHKKLVNKPKSKTLTSIQNAIQVHKPMFKMGVRNDSVLRSKISNNIVELCCLGTINKELSETNLNQGQKNMLSFLNRAAID